MPSNSKNTVYFSKDSDPSPEDDIYIDCQPVNEKNVTISDSYSGDSLDSQISSEVLNDINGSKINIFQNPGIKSILAAGIFAIILFSGNYIFNKLPNSKLQKAIDRERYS